MECITMRALQWDYEVPEAVMPVVSKAPTNNESKLLISVRRPLSRISGKQVLKHHG